MTDNTLPSNEYRFILRQDFMSFSMRAFLELNPKTHFLPAPNLELIAAKLEACRQGKITRLIITLPPRALKSLMATVAFPAWLLGHSPSSQIICASYGQDLADKHARDCRAVMMSPWYRQLFPQMLLAPDKQSVNEFATITHGFRMATSVEGVLTGRGGDFIIIDDPSKPEEALSDVRRKRVNDWYDNTLISRLNNKKTGCIIMVMQRLHQDDLVGHVLAQEGWEVLRCPAMAEADEEYPFETPFGPRIYHRQAGEPLHPERESLVTLKQMRQSMTEYNFQSQYQQNPIPMGGMMVKAEWLYYYEQDQPLPTFYLILQSWDTANKSGELNDFSVCTTWGVHDGHYYLLDVYRKRLNYPELKRAVLAQAGKFSAHKILIEDKASGTQLIQDLQHEGLFGIKPYKPPPAADKQVRLYAQTAEFENGHVLLPRKALWLAEYVRELTSFPGSKYDDQVDSTTQALEHLKTHRGLEIWAKLGRLT